LNNGKSYKYKTPLFLTAF